MKVACSCRHTISSDYQSKSRVFRTVDRTRWSDSGLLIQGDWEIQIKVEDGRKNLVSLVSTPTKQHGNKEGRSSNFQANFSSFFFIIVSTRVGEKTCLKFFGISINGRGKGIIRSNNGTRIFLEPWNPRLSNWSIELHPPRDWTERSPFYWKKSDDLVVLTFFFFLFFSASNLSRPTWPKDSNIHNVSSKHTI